MSATPANDNLLTISVIGKPKGNVPLELFKAIRERGGEVEDCRIAQIGDRLVANLLVTQLVLAPPPQGA